MQTRVDEIRENLKGSIAKSKDPLVKAALKRKLNSLGKNNGNINKSYV